VTQFDFNLHDYVRLRLIDATHKEADVIQRQLGPIAAPFSGAPDLTIRFVDPAPEPPGLRYIGLNDAAYTQDGFFVLKGKNKARIKAQIPFDKIGLEPAEVVCERGITNIPLLIPMINLILLSKGVTPFHASAVSYQGEGILMTGWAKGGKTETLLSFMMQGASYVGDEWIYLCPDGASMFGIPEPIRVWDWHLKSLPDYRARLNRKDKFKLGSLSALSRSIQWAAGVGSNGSGAPARLAQRLAPVVQRQTFVHFAPYTLFGADHIQATSAIDKIFFTASHNQEEITVMPVDAENIAQRMSYSMREEQQVVISYYMKYRFAFPDRANPWLDNLERIQTKLLTRALAGKEMYAVYHPYPVHIPRLFEAVQPYLQ